ncbi:MAG: hypothetical protein MZV70_68805 [Desulfobacterales bacterium]|nr:hypothetical protein [Desulfobacterales bacterium]
MSHSPVGARRPPVARIGSSAPAQYCLEQFETAETHDTLWNAAQRQLIEEGTIHNYLRMLWGKKILEWTESPREAPGHHDRAHQQVRPGRQGPRLLFGHTSGYWDAMTKALGPIRPVAGKIRYMSSANTLRKLKVVEYLDRFGWTGSVGRVSGCQHCLPFVSTSGHSHAFRALASSSNRTLPGVSTRCSKSFSRTASRWFLFERLPFRPRGPLHLSRDGRRRAADGCHLRGRPQDRPGWRLRL